MSTKPRTPEHFPRMKHRAAKRQFTYLLITVDLKPFIEACRKASEALAKMSMGYWEVGRKLSPPPLEPTQPTTEAAPNRAASFMPGGKS